MQQPILQTDRLVLRPFTPDDAAAVQRLAGDKTVAGPTGSVPHPYLDGMAESWIKAQRKAFREGTQAVFAVTLGAGGEPAGAMSLMDISAAHRRAGLGYRTGRGFRGRGYATDAAHAVVRYGFSAFGLRRIHARCLKLNAASARVLEKTGMRLEGCLRQHEFRSGRPEDILLYGLLLTDLR